MWIGHFLLLGHHSAGLRDQASCFEEVHGLVVDNSFRMAATRPLSFTAASQLCLSILPMLPIGIIILDAQRAFWHVTWEQPTRVQCCQALQLIAAGARCVAWCSVAERWRCTLLRKPGAAPWLGSLCPGAGSATLHNLVAHIGAGTDPGEEGTCDLAGGSACKPPAAEGLTPQLGERVMILKDHWLRLILSGAKAMELRRRRAKTGWTWLGKGNIIHARARIVACQELTVETFETYPTQHQLEAAGPPYVRTFALWLEDVQLLEKATAIFKPWGTVGRAIVRFQQADLPTRTKTRPRQKARHASYQEAGQAITGARLRKHGPDQRWQHVFSEFCIASAISHARHKDRAAVPHAPQLRGGLRVVLAEKHNAGT